MNKRIKRAENTLFIAKVLRSVSINSRCCTERNASKIWIDKCSWEKIASSSYPCSLSLALLRTRFSQSTYPIYFIIKRLEKLLHYFSVMWIWHAWIAFSPFQLSDLFLTLSACSICIAFLRVLSFIYLFILRFLRDAFNKWFQIGFCSHWKKQWKITRKKREVNG